MAGAVAGVGAGHPCSGGRAEHWMTPSSALLPVSAPKASLIAQRASYDRKRETDALIVACTL
jgi:hypothetical protein